MTAVLHPPIPTSHVASGGFTLAERRGFARYEQAMDALSHAEAVLTHLTDLLAEEPCNEYAQDALRRVTADVADLERNMHEVMDTIDADRWEAWVER